MISDCLHHDTIAVYLFQKYFSGFLKDLLPARSYPRNIIFFSDGAASQYKNRKNFLNFCNHKADLEMKLNGIFQPLHLGRGHVIVWVER